MTVQYRQSAIKDLKKLDIQARKSIKRKIDDLEKLDNIFQNPNIKKIKNAPSSWYRYRIGNYRIILDVEGFILSVIYVRKRNERTYKNL